MSIPRSLHPADGPKLDLAEYVPEALRGIENPNNELPKIAKEKGLTRVIQDTLKEIPTNHALLNTDSRDLSFIPPGSVHLAVTSPPYWTLKHYNESEAQLGMVEDYENFLLELDKVWEHCHRVLVPGGRLICVVGDVCLSRRKNKGRHTVVPLHASIQEHCRRLGFDNLAPIIWHKIANAVHEVEGGSSFLGKPYEPNAVVKNDIEFILMQRKPGGYRNPTVAARILSVISEENHGKWFQQIWTGLTGASTKEHPAPYPAALAERLIRMFSFVGDTVLDPFMGTASTNVAAAKCARNSIGVEVDVEYYNMAKKRMKNEAAGLFNTVSSETIPA